MKIESRNFTVWNMWKYDFLFHREISIIHRKAYKKKSQPGKLFVHNSSKLHSVYPADKQIGIDWQDK